MTPFVRSDQIFRAHVSFGVIASDLLQKRNEAKILEREAGFAVLFRQLYFACSKRMVVAQVGKFSLRNFRRIGVTKITNFRIDWFPFFAETNGTANHVLLQIDRVHQ